MNENLNRFNFARVFGDFLKEGEINIRSAAKAIGCSEPTMSRLLRNMEQRTFPTDEMLKQVGIMMVLSYSKYSKLSKAEKSKISEGIGTVIGGGIGFATIASTVSGFGAVAGLSAAGISSGLAAMGGLLGGGMMTGVAVAAAIPVAVGAAGLGAGMGIKYLICEHFLDKTEIDPNWEMPS
jgi:hypothetical protein